MRHTATCTRKRRRGSAVLLLCLLIPLASLTSNAQNRPPATHFGPRPPTSPTKDYGRLPLSFEPNLGQTDQRVKFLSRGRGYSLFLTADEAVLALQRAGGTEVKRSADRKVSEAQESAVLRMRLVGANAAPKVIAADPLPGKSNYFLGNNPGKWRKNVSHYARVVRQGVYAGVDVAFHGQNGQLEFDFVVSPGADPRRIRLRLEGARQLRLDDDGDLILSVGGEELRFRRPFAYQETASGLQQVAAGYRLLGRNQVGFVLAPYDENLPLIIDPTLVYSTFLGGSINDFGNGIAVDAQGNVYLVGTTNSPEFPVVNAIQPALAFSDDAFVLKLNAAGDTILFSTFLGGNDIDFGNGISLDPVGNIYLAGTTQSTNFPTMDAFGMTPQGGADAFVAKLTGDGSALVYSSYLGGSSTENGNSIAVDAQGSAYVTGTTISLNFPTVQGIQPSTNPVNTPEAFVTKFTPLGNALVYSTYLGGSSSDSGLSIAVDTAGSAYVAGRTSSPDFPLLGSIQAFGGVEDAFVTKFSAAGSALAYSTYLGGSGNDIASGIAVDSGGSAYVGGMTTSSDFPTLNPIQPAFAGAVDAFVAKLDAGGTSLVYATYLGGSTSDRANGIAVDPGGNVYVAGETDSVDFPKSNAIQPDFLGWEDGFVTVLDAAGSAFVFSSYFGGSGGYDSCRSIAADAAGNAYVSGRTDSPDFPVQNAIQSALAGARDAFVAKFSLAPLTVSINDVSVTEGDTTTRLAVFVVSLSAPSPQTVTVDFATADGTAIAGEDYAARTGTVTLTPGQTTTEISITINSDILIEPDETFLVNLSNPTNAALAKAQGSGTIVNDDFPITVSISDVTVDEGNTGTTTAALTVTLSAASTQTVTVDFATADDTATIADNDYVSQSGVLTFNPGETSKQIGTTINGDTSSEPDETFVVNLSNPLNAAIADGQGVVTIRNDEVATILVNETILVTDVSALLPSAMFTVPETIQVTDTLVLLPSAMFTVPENIQVTDAPMLLPSAIFTVPETIQVSDAPALVPPAMITVPEAIRVSDALFVGNTPAGTDIVVQPIDTTTGGTPATLTFPSVTQAGTTSLTTSSTGPAPPSGFRLGTPPVYFDLTSTAVFSGPVTVCIDYTGINFFGVPRLFHFENGIWVNRTVSVDTVNQVACAEVSSFSFFALFQEADFSLQASPPIFNLTAGLTATYTLTISSLGGFTASVDLGCTGYPELSACTIAPNSVTLAANGTATATITIQTNTTGQMTMRGLTGHPLQSRVRVVFLVGLFLLAFAVLCFWTWLASRYRSPARISAAVVLAVVLLLCLLSPACVGGGAETPAGTYTITITGTSGTLVRTTTVLLQVR